MCGRSGLSAIASLTPSRSPSRISFLNSERVMRGALLPIGKDKEQVEATVLDWVCALSLHADIVLAPAVWVRVARLTLYNHPMAEIFTRVEHRPPERRKTCRAELLVHPNLFLKVDPLEERVGVVHAP